MKTLLSYGGCNSRLASACHGMASHGSYTSIVLVFSMWSGFIEHEDKEAPRRPPNKSGSAIAPWPALEDVLIRLDISLSGHIGRNNGRLLSSQISWGR